MKPARLTVVLFACAALAGCGGSDLDEVQEFVKNAHADKKPRVEPLPEMKTFESFAYGAQTLTDPFASFNLKTRAAKGGSQGGPQPDETRRREPLEDFPLDSLKMVGTLSRGKQVYAVIQAPDGTVHRTKIGDHLGQNFGRITRISEEKVDMIELVQGALGDWVERETGVSLAE